jgi:BON domain
MPGMQDGFPGATHAQPAVTVCAAVWGLRRRYRGSMDTRSLLIGFATGSTLMFMLDPNAGGRRRALIRDQTVRATRKTRDGLDATARDFANRAGGIAATIRGRWTDEPVSDEVLEKRVRASLGRVCSHPHAVMVDTRDNQVTLRGPVLASEVGRILAATAAVRGVAAVTNELDAHESGDGIPALQGEGRVAGPALDILQPNWAPGTQAVVAAGLLASAVWMAMSARRGWNGLELSHAAA